MNQRNYFYSCSRPHQATSNSKCEAEGCILFDESGKNILTDRGSCGHRAIVILSNRSNTKQLDAYHQYRYTGICWNAAVHYAKLLLIISHQWRQFISPFGAEAVEGNELASVNEQNADRSFYNSITVLPRGLSINWGWVLRMLPRYYRCFALT